MLCARLARTCASDSPSDSPRAVVWDLGTTSSRRRLRYAAVLRPRATSDCESMGPDVAKA